MGTTMMPITMSRDEVGESTVTAIAEACRVSAGQIEDVYACTPLQVATMAESAIRTGASVFQFVFSLAESVDLDRFSAALQRVVALNAVLRTRLVDCRLGLLQVVISEDHDTQRLSGDTAEYLRDDKARPMDLGAPLFRSALIDRKLVLTMHHAIMDHTALSPLFQDMLQIYNGQVPETHAPFKDFVAHCNAIDEITAKPFWSSRFKGTPVIFPKVDQGYVPHATQQETRTIKLDQIGARIPLAHVPSYIEAAWALTARIFTGSDSIGFGVVLSGRTSTLAGAETTLGPTIATIPVQVNIQRSMTVEGIVKDRSTALRQLQTSAALQYGITKIRAVSDAAAIASRFQTLLNIRPSYYDPSKSTEITYEHMDEPQGAFSLCLSCNLMDTGVFVEAMSDPTVLCERQLRRVLNQFEHTLKALMDASPTTKLSQLQLLNSHDRLEILQWNSAIAQPVEQCVHDLFRARAEEQPSAMAVEACDGSATYHELDELSDRLARELQQRGVSPGDTIAFVFEKSLWTIVAILGIMKAGGACVPLDQSDPPARKAGFVSSAKAKVVLTSSMEHAASANLAPHVITVSAETILGFPGGTDPPRDGISSPDDLAYVLFTSGSTGTPKGVMLEHRCLASSLTSLAQRFGWRSGDRILQFAAHVWDISIGEIFGALLFGGCLCIPSEEARKSSLANFIQSSKVNRAWLTPTVLRTISLTDVPDLQSLLSIGEPISPDAAKTWGGALRLINGWGPCEATVLSAAAELSPASLYPETIGTPTGCALWIVSSGNINELAPIGAMGEILIEGAGVARGYLNDKTKTAAAFILPPAWAPVREKKSRHFYRTGDLGRYYPDGSICFMGRKDNQVKIRGQRFELGELESVLSGFSEVRDVCATTKINGGRTELVAVICLADTELPRETVLQDLSDANPKLVAQRLRAVQEHARAKLPSFVVPTIWFAVEQMPRTASAKLDRATVGDWLKTKDLSAARATLDGDMTLALTSPTTEEEKLLRSVWSSGLGIPAKNIKRESSFLQLGGDSILAMQIVTRVRRDGLQIPTAALLRSEPLSDVAKSAVLENTDDATPLKAAAQNNHRCVTTPSAESILGNLKARSSHHCRAKKSIQSEDVTSIAPATDVQATMLALGSPGTKGYHVSFTLEFTRPLDTSQLRKACEKVVEHHEILRTQFVQQGSALYQVVTKSLGTEMVIDGERPGHSTTPEEMTGLSRFHLYSNGQSCQGLCIEIHHVLYDAISLGLIFQDLRAAYVGKPLSDGPSFTSWISHIESIDGSRPREYWRKLLQGSSMSNLVPPTTGWLGGHTLDEQLQIRVPLRNLQSSSGTASSVMKAAWALLLSRALGTRDVVFGEISANRYLAWPGIDQVRGPCVNNVPVRARFKPGMSLAALIAQMQDQAATGLPYHHLGIRDIIKDCTAWPRWTRFSSALVYQNHGSLDASLQIGDAECALTYRGTLGNSADIWVIATPGAENLDIEIRFSAHTISSEQVRWIGETLVSILEATPSNLEQSLDHLGNAVQKVAGSYPAHSSPPTAHSNLLNGHPRAPSAEAQDLVLQAWKEVEIFSDDQTEDSSMFSCGADLVTALLLSEYYRRYQYDVSAEVITRHPTRSMQACLLGLVARNGTKY